MKNSILSLGLILTILSSCGSSGSSSEGTEESTSVPSSNATCVFDYMDKYDQLLPLEAIQKHYAVDVTKAKMKYSKSEAAERQNHDSYLYSWPSDRTKTMEFGGNKLEIPIPNEIGIKWLGDDLYKINGLKDPVESFYKFYRTVSKEELNAALGKAEAKISEDKNVKEETKNQAMDMAKGLAEGASYEDVKGIGNAASWDARDNALIILIGDKTLKIVSSVSADSETNKALAIKLASEVLAKCN
jgi:hypothetical protein